MKCNIDYETIGKRIRDARKKVGMTQEQLSEHIDCASTYINAIEKNRSKPSLSALVLIADALDTTVNHLLYDDAKDIVSEDALYAEQIIKDCSPGEKQFLLRMMEYAKKLLPLLEGKEPDS